MLNVMQKKGEIFFSTSNQSDYYIFPLGFELVRNETSCRILEPFLHGVVLVFAKNVDPYKICFHHSKFNSKIAKSYVKVCRQI